MTNAQVAVAIVVVIALLWFGGKMWVSFDSEGGSIGMVPVLDGALFPPFFGWLSVGLIDGKTGWPGWPWWVHLVGWLLTTVLSWWLIGKAGEWGERRHRRQ